MGKGNRTPRTIGHFNLISISICQDSQHERRQISERGLQTDLKGSNHVAFRCSDKGLNTLTLHTLKGIIFTITILFPMEIDGSSASSSSFFFVLLCCQSSLVQDQTLSHSLALRVVKGISSTHGRLDCV